MKATIHTVYKLKSGDRVPSVTTVLGILNKPNLLDWAWRCGCEGKDYKAIRDQAADIGTLAHALVVGALTGEKVDLTEYSQEQIDKAETCLIKYYDWLKEHPIEPILLETQFVSEIHRFGGTIDCLAKLNGSLVLIDHKTSKAVWPEMFYQLAAYRQLLREAGHQVDDCRIVRIGRDPEEGFEERQSGNLDKAWELFTHCLAVYQLQKEVK